MIDESSGYFGDSDIGKSDISTLANEGYIVGERFYVSADGYTELYYARRAGRMFILKALRREYRADAIAIAALRKEFELGFRLDIPGLVKTFDLVTLPPIGLAIVLEHCRGDNLRKLMDAGVAVDGPTLKEAARSLVGIVDDMHRSGVIHRDIKPSNIILDLESGGVRLIDFGCADAFDHTLFKGEAGTRLYKTSEFSNTPAQDWYALSLTLTELAGHCSYRKCTRGILRSCAVMRKGRKPVFKDRDTGHTGRIVAAVSALLIALSGIVGYLAFNNRDQDDVSHIIAPVTRPSDSVPVTKPHPDIAVTRVANDRDVTSEPGIPAQPVPPAPSVPATPSASTIPQENNPDADGYPGHTADNPELFRVSKNHVKPEEDISEVNFSSVDGKYDPIVEKVRDAAEKVSLAAERREFKIYQSIQRSGKKLTQHDRDSITLLVYDEKRNCDAILAEMGPLPHGTDMARVKHLVRQRYLTLFRGRLPQTRKN